MSKLDEPVILINEKGEHDPHIVIRTEFCLIIKPSTRANFSNLFWKENLHVSDTSSVHHQEFFTVHTAVVYVIQVC